MAYKVLARKWRPQIFEEVIGQQHVTRTLENAVKTGRLAHAYLFSGPRGVGKTSVARILAKAINCEQGENGEPCNSCRSCLEITDGSSVDVQEIDGASNRGIDEIRELRDSIRYMPSSSRYRVYIIDEVHMLTPPAFNAMLKTLEEPPEHVKFIFATTEYHKVPVTIHSRCQRFDFKRIPNSSVVDQLEKIAKIEDITISRNSLASIAREAEGSMRDAESLLDQVISFTGNVVEEKEVSDILGIIDRDVIFEISGAILAGSEKKCLEVVERIYNSGFDLKEFYRAVMEQFRNLLVCLVAPESLSGEMIESERNELINLAGIAGIEKLQVILGHLIVREESMRFTSSPRLILETILVKLCGLESYLSFGELIRKMELLEERLKENMFSEGKSAHDYISEPGKGWNPEGEAEDSGINGGGNGLKDWEGFLQYLYEKSKTMHSILKDWEFLRLTEKKLEIRKTNQTFSSAFFDNSDRYDQLSSFCEDFFGRPLRIEIKRGNARIERMDSADNNVLSQEKTDHKSLSPPVREIINLFDGEIKDIAAEKKSKSPKDPGIG